MAICAVAEDGPAAVGPRVGSRGQCQDQLAVLVALLDAGRHIVHVGDIWRLTVE